MPIPLAYETPQWVESRGVKRGARAAMIFLGAFLALSILVTTFVTARIHPMSLWLYVAFACSTTIGGLGVGAGLTARSTVRVYTDRIELGVSTIGLTVWKRRLHWSEVARCDLYEKWRPTQADAPRPPIRAIKKFAVLGRTIGWTIVMCGGDGVGFLLQNGDSLLLGSDDPPRLLGALSDSRQLFLSSESNASDSPTSTESNCAGSTSPATTSGSSHR